MIHPVLSSRKIEHSLGHAHTLDVDANDPSDWRIIEGLAEEHPYIVALLSSMKNYLCTGSIINKRCVLTSGHCAANKPKYVVNSAVYTKGINNNTIFNVYSTTLHTDYIFDLQKTNPNITKLHSNIGLVFVDRPFLELFINIAEMGNYFASELRNKKMIAIGYGYLDTPNTVVLQSQTYLQVPCLNPKWYYCVCGKEYQMTGKTYLAEFGVGAPLLLESVLVGVTAAPCGSLSRDAMKYNIFTVVGPYLPWMEKITTQNSTKKLVYDIYEDYEDKVRNKGVGIQQYILLKHVHIFVMISKMFI